MTNWSTRDQVNALLLGLTTIILGTIAAYAGGFIGTDATYVQTVFAERRSLTRVVEVFGRVHPATWVTIRPDVSGKIVALPVEEGAPVESGDLLVQIRSDEYDDQIDRVRAQVQQRRAGVARHRADSIQARRRYARQKRLYKQGVSFRERLQEARYTLERTTARLEAARARLAQARARLKDVKQQKRQTTIRAPTGGVISRLNVEIGERVVGTDLFPGTRMMRITPVDQMEFRVSIDESDVMDVTSGDSATIQLDAYPGLDFSGEVISTAQSRRLPSANEPSGSVSEIASGTLFDLGAGFPARLNVRPPPSQKSAPDLRTGMGGTARIRTATAPNALSVPQEAITYRRGSPPSDSTESRSSRKMRTVVFVVRNGTARRTDVETGIRTESRVQIRSGLQPGDEVVVGPTDVVQQRLTDGTSVEASLVSRASAPLAEF